MLIPGSETEMRIKPTKEQIKKTIEEARGMEKMSRTASSFFKEKLSQGRASVKELLMGNTQGTIDVAGEYGGEKGQGLFSSKRKTLDIASTKNKQDIMCVASGCIDLDTTHMKQNKSALGKDEPIEEEDFFNSGSK